jgi:hypothetical protein
MTSAQRIASAIVTAAFVIVGIPIAYDELKQWRMARAFQQLDQSFSQELDRSVRAQRAADQQRVVHQREALAARHLASDERCVAGTVLRVGHAAYVQVLENGKPVACEGLYRKR